MIRESEIQLLRLTVNKWISLHFYTPRQNLVSSGSRWLNRSAWTKSNIDPTFFVFQPKNQEKAIFSKCCIYLKLKLHMTPPVSWLLNSVTLQSPFTIWPNYHQFPPVGAISFFNQNWRKSRFDWKNFITYVTVFLLNQNLQQFASKLLFWSCISEHKSL